MANKKRSQKAGKSLNLSPLFYQITSLLLIILGAGILIALSFNRFPGQLPPPQPKQESAYEVQPAKLYIPNLAKPLSISNGVVVNNRWQISETGVSYMTASAIPGKVGNSVVYGHNKTEILGNLPKVVSGDPVYIIMKSGDIVKYEVFETKEVSPNQVEILNQTADARLTIYTCIGFLDQARFVVLAKQTSNTI